MTRAVVLMFALAVGCAAYRPTADAVVVARAAAPGRQPDPADVKALESTLRALLLKNLPEPLVSSSDDWGRQAEGVVGHKFHKDGLRLRTEQLRGMRNDGTWRKIELRAVNPSHTLGLGIVEAAYPEPGRATFTAHVGTDCAIKFEQQLWRNGTRLYSGETRARCRAAVAMKCEAVTRVERKDGGIIPDVVCRLKVTDAQLFYEKLVVEHTAGIGGDGARVLGDAVIETVRRVKPQLERDLLAKANAAVVKAADTKEVRLSVDSLLKGR
ncbi:hypothetical protein [Urbifossiella limnaea]|uniref:Lipoprotein n=1 Tax=Urbifossiella limnaea TaxID=2528023 RepID=A0A517XYI9_9BACT|nr:hypothetical protein [Urbifossiella limnaea]QDU22600.1 hypothetical protein ETAA1_45830 [Urbifossiella limnaea]